MNELNCIIVDDDNIIIKQLEYYIERAGFLKHKGSFNNANDAVKIAEFSGIDLIFLDIEMPGMTGLEFIGKIPNIPQIIMISAHSRYAIDAFDNNVTDFLLKPIEYSRFLKAATKAQEINNALKTISGPSIDDIELFIKKSNQSVKIKVNDILFVKALADYVEIHTKDDKHIIHSTMKNIESKLSSFNFARTHRSYIVDVKKITKIETESVYLGTVEVPMSKTYKADLLAKLNLF